MDAGRDDTEPGQLTDSEGQERARAYVAELLGEPADLCWDGTHHLQGHVHIGDCELIVIAPRDLSHEPIVLTSQDWDEARHAPGCDAVDLIRRRCIRDHDRLVDVVH